MDKDVLKKSSLCEAFKDILDNESLKAFNKVFITNLCYHKSEKKIDLKIECPEFIMSDQISKLEREISDHFKARVHIRPGFMCEIKEELSDWQRELVLSCIKDKKPHMIHFLDGAHIKVSGRNLCVNLKDQSAAILSSAGVGKCLEDAMETLFYREVKVNFIDAPAPNKSVDYLTEKQEAEARMVAEMMSSQPLAQPQKTQKVQKYPQQNQSQPAKPSNDNGFVKYRKGGSSKQSSDPNLIFGKGIKGQVVKMDQVDTNSGLVTIEGQILKTDKRVLKTGRTLYTFDITDYSSSITCKLFPKEEELEIVSEKLVKGQNIRLSGEAQYDMFSKELVILARDILLITVEKETRTDNAPVKRVELHLHTQMSQLDAVSGTKDLIKRAAKWGHRAVAITDHGVVQAYPEAQDTASDLKKKQDKEIKILYGMESYFIADEKLNAKGELDYKHCDTYHAVILVKNQIGLKNLYRLVSESHLKYFYKKPRLPKSLFDTYREGLIIGSACEAGELYQAVYKGLSDEEIEQIASYYDYLEIQPIGNNGFMIREGMVSD